MEGELTGIDLRADEHREVVRLLQHHLPDTEVWAYGSRVKGTARPASDLDLVTFASAGQNEAVSRLREAFDESSLPFRVDLFVWDKVPEEFRKNIEEARVVVQEKEKKNLPKGWQQVILGDVITINDATYSSKDKWSFINYLDTGNLTNGEISEVKRFTIGTDKIPSRAKRKIQPGDIVYSTVRPNQKHFGIIKNLPENLLVSTAFVTIRGKKEKADTNFVYFLLTQRETIEILQTIGEHSTSAYPSIKSSDIEVLKFNLPPLPEQKAIAHILGSLDDKIELNRRMNETLEAMAQALFKSWFVDFDPVIDNALAAGNVIPDELKEKAAIRQGLDDERKSLPDDIRRLFPSKFAHTEEMGWIPKGWTPQSIDSIIEIDPAVNLPKNTLAPFVDMKALPFKGYSVTAINKKPYAGGAKFQNGDVLLARITPCLENGKTAIVDFLDSGQVGFGSTEFIVLRSKAPIPTPFVACLSRNAEFREHCIKSMVGSSGRQRVQKDCFSRFYLSLPEKDMLLNKFFLLTEKNFEQAHKCSKQSRLLADLRDTLLPKLLSGEISATEAEKSEGGLCQIK